MITRKEKNVQLKIVSAENFFQEEKRMRKKRQMEKILRLVAFADIFSSFL